LRKFQPTGDVSVVLQQLGTPLEGREGEPAARDSEVRGSGGEDEFGNQLPAWGQGRGEEYNPEASAVEFSMAPALGAEALCLNGGPVVHQSAPHGAGGGA